jgi:lysozyme
MLDGIDVSHWQGLIDWPNVAASGSVHFAMVKATEGAEMKDQRFEENWRALSGLTIRQGAYHMLRFNVDGATQARFFLETANPRPGNLVPAVDAERGDPATAEARVETLAAFISTVEASIGQRMMIYSNPSFWNDSMGGSNRFSAYPLWIAHHDVPVPRLPHGWQSWTMWQYTNKKSVAGIAGGVDWNHLNGDEPMLEALVIGYAANRIGCLGMTLGRS